MPVSKSVIDVAIKLEMAFSAGATKAFRTELASPSMPFSQSVATFEKFPLVMYGLKILAPTFLLLDEVQLVGRSKLVAVAKALPVLTSPKNVSGIPNTIATMSLY